MSSWIEDLMARALLDPSGRLVSMECDEIELDGVAVGRVLLTFTVEDLRGGTYEAQGRVLVPVGVGPNDEAPVVYHCGYEMPEALAARHVLARGRISATVVQTLPLDAVFPNAWSLTRGPKAEIVFGHLVRSMSFVDPARVVYAGGSAGGYSALMAAAEAFPCAGAVPSVPPTNLAYMSAWTEWNLTHIPDSEVMSKAWIQGMGAAVTAWKAAHGEDYDGAGWLGHSPVGHVERITCPVLTFFSMSDVLVPVSQVDNRMAQAIEAARPGGVEFRSQIVSDAPAAQVKLLDVLGDRALVQVVTVPDDIPPMEGADLTMITEMSLLPLPPVEAIAGRWNVLVADEGEPVFVVSHYKHQYEPDLTSFIDTLLETPVGVDQLTAPKLDQLLARWTGQEWLAPGYSSLDRPEAERADVEMGLRIYCAASPANTDRFNQLYRDLAPDRRLLPEVLVAELGQASAAS
jgi:hypothetical protein